MIIPRFQHVSYLLVCVILLLLSTLQQTPPLEVQEWDCRGFSSSAAPRSCAGAVWERWHRAGGKSIQVSLEMAVPSPHSLACPELLPARDSFSASLNPAAGSSWRQGVVAQLYLCLCLPSTLCQRHPALLPDLGRGSVCSCWEKLSPAIQHRGRAGMRMSWDLWI